ncbi:26S proteasome non-ATPase regulatory subunit 14 [Cavenderia fasciculata]|uniref:26S proteasome non-ATPase regulatory subunit 14 n=1 Tax=Cavenderia fasciculata TaxID=261658 RepID=F4PU51_CACFS|nr:26S proteasome non-ATPase regulatory subunit 14 [Cavenderia fasciculata]EGG20977.1 26S proteasome non-ATPase regulatory subunit 14 [Cavenderia fasciculata]|eukprot:XP_004358827.1 26S proteasome non-ATPase regulatory subunit 14 [Cavenderia fasciculata]
MNRELMRQLLGGRDPMEKITDATPLPDTAETIHISSLALLKMLQHARAGVPLEVMGLMLGELIDEYTIRVIDVFAMPQSGTSVSVEAIDPVFQTKMLEMLKQTGRNEIVIGWYHSHPGFGCWLSSVDVNTQQSFEQLQARAVAVVVDPLQSVRGKVVIDAFRTIKTSPTAEPRQITSNLGHLQDASIQALIHGLNRNYYSIAINYRKNELEQKMLLNLHKKKWTDALTLEKFDTYSQSNEKKLSVRLKKEKEKEKETKKQKNDILELTKSYHKSIQDEDKIVDPEKKEVQLVGKLDAKKHLVADVHSLMASNVVRVLTVMLDTTTF